MKKIISTLLAAILLLSLPLSASAADYSKDETVYVNLAADGTPMAVYVVNGFESGTAQSLDDYGDYASVKPITTKDGVSYANGVANVTLPEGRYYYQGEASDLSLPWAFEIRYLLDGKLVTESELAGNSGALEMSISVSAGAEKHIDFFEHYVCQISYTLDARKVSNVNTSGNIAVVGSNINVTHTHMSGKEASYTLTADVTDFEMGGITIRAVPMSGVDIDTAKIDEMTAGFSEMDEATGKLTDAGSGIVDASGKFSDGLSNFSDKAGGIVTASSQINNGIGALADNLNTLAGASVDAQTLAKSLLGSEDPQVKALAKAYLAQCEAVSGAAQATGTLSENYKTFHSGLSALPNGLDDMESGYGKLDSALGEYVSAVDTLCGELANVTGEVDTKIDELLGEYTGGDFTLVSFMSDKNTVSSVTFVMKTDGIHLISVPVEPVAVLKPETFWEKLLDLFGLFNG